MSIPSSPRTIGRAALLTVLTLAMAAVPSIAAAKTRVVDDDGKASVASCDAKTAAATKIQKAINQSGPGDTVKVCPGVYAQKLLITGDRDGLTLVSSTPKGATIKDPSVYQITPLALVRVEEVSGVTVKDFKIRTLSWETYDTQTMDGILVSGAGDVTIRGNHISWTGDAGDRSNLSRGILIQNGSSGVISKNTIIDPLDDGIHATGSGVDVTISGNTIKALFEGHASVSADDGIEIRSGAKANVKGNTIEAGPGTAPAQSKFAAGVELYQPGLTTYVRDNTITSPVRGIEARANGASLYDNVIVARQVGISLADMDNGEVIGNTARATKAIGYGISALDASNNNQIEGNDVRDSFGPDCHEADTDTNGINNDWIDNQTNSANDADPDGLCDDGDVPA